MPISWSKLYFFICQWYFSIVDSFACIQITGEVITTPYVLLQPPMLYGGMELNPFLLILNHFYCNINPEKIEEAITARTTAILPVHVYGNPCSVEKFNKLQIYMV